MSFTSVISLAAYGLEQIGAILKSDAAGDAAAALRAIGAIYNAIDSAAVGHVTPESARAEIDRLVATLQANDAAADRALDDKFRDSGP